ncbi:uncharacterized protein [Amphiura filiformis]|uniref:uncharacterized protein n=1 Tax=Amphiura filiformis TaxID=82378 RepID=UPI003B21C97F
MTRRMPLFLGTCLFSALILAVLLNTESGSQVILQPLTILVNNNSTQNTLRTVNTTIRIASRLSDISGYDDDSGNEEKNNSDLYVSTTASFEAEETEEDKGRTETPTPTTNKETEKVLTTKPTDNAPKTDGMVEVLHNEQLPLVTLKSQVKLTPNQLSDNLATPETHLLDVSNLHSQSEPACSPTHGVAFIKTHKTGSTTLGHIVNRYGYSRNLSFVFNKHSPNNGHLYYLPITNESPKKDFLPPIGVKEGEYSKYKYDLIAVHIRYNRTPMDTFMKPGTNYITIIRDPGHQFESAFTHFQMDDAFLPTEKQRYTTMSSRIGHWLSKPDYYRQRLQQLPWEGKKGLRWFYSKNTQIFDLGLDHVFHDDARKVSEYIEHLDEGLAVVLITEHFDESMVLLKHTLCWSMDDIIYIAKNVRPNPAQIGDSIRQKIRQWNSVDTQLYEHFNNTLWRKIKALGPAFDIELAKFKARMSDVFETCVGAEQVKAQGHYFHWLEYKQRKDSGALCKLIVESKRTLFFSIWKKQVPPKPKPATKRIVVKKPAAPKPPSNSSASVQSASKNGLQALQDRLVKPQDLLTKSGQTSFKATELIYKDAKTVSSTGVGPDNPEDEASVNDREMGHLPDFVNPDLKKPVQVKASSSSKKSRL